MFVSCLHLCLAIETRTQEQVGAEQGLTQFFPRENEYQDDAPTNELPSQGKKSLINIRQKEENTQRPNSYLSNASYYFSQTIFN